MNDEYKGDHCTVKSLNFAAKCVRVFYYRTNKLLRYNNTWTQYSILALPHISVLTYICYYHKLQHGSKETK